MRATLIALVLLLGASEARAQDQRPSQADIVKDVVRNPEAYKDVYKTVPEITDFEAPSARPKPSGYWTGYRPARHGAYRWTMLGIAVALLGVTVLFVLRLLRKATAENKRRGAAATASSGSSAAPS